MWHQDFFYRVLDCMDVLRLMLLFLFRKGITNVEIFWKVKVFFKAIDIILRKSYVGLWEKYLEIGKCKVKAAMVRYEL